MRRLGHRCLRAPSRSSPPPPRPSWSTRWPVKSSARPASLDAHWLNPAYLVPLVERSPASGRTAQFWPRPRSRRSPGTACATCARSSTHTICTATERLPRARSASWKWVMRSGSPKTGKRILQDDRQVDRVLQQKEEKLIGSIGCPSWIHIELCVLPRSPPFGGFLRKFQLFASRPDDHRQRCGHPRKLRTSAVTGWVAPQ